jgi:hypothetical protein
MAAAQGLAGAPRKLAAKFPVLFLPAIFGNAGELKMQV